MNHPYTSQPGDDASRGFSYEPGSNQPVTGAPYPKEMSGFVAPTMTERRPGAVTGAIVLLWVMSGLTLASAALVMLLVVLRAAQTVSGSAGIIGGIMIILMLVVYAALMMVAAIRIPKKADAARVLALVLMGFFVFSNLSYIVFVLAGFAAASATGPVGIGIIGVFLSVVIATMPAIVIALLSVRNTVSWFYGNPAAATVQHATYMAPPPPPMG